jgi:hypothetical protein
MIRRCKGSRYHLVVVDHAVNLELCSGLQYCAERVVVSC